MRLRVVSNESITPEKPKERRELIIEEAQRKGFTESLRSGDKTFFAFHNDDMIGLEIKLTEKEEKWRLSYNIDGFMIINGLECCPFIGNKHFDNFLKRITYYSKIMKENNVF